MNEKQHMVDVSLVHGSSNTGGRHSAIEIIDPLSWAKIRIELDMETLGSLLHGGRDHRVRATFQDLELLGRKRIRKTVKVTIKSLPYGKKDKFVRELARKYEVNGWIFTGPQDSWSQSDHGHDGKTEWVRLHFKKYVKARQEKSNVDSSK